ncbi:MAG: beta-propeller fold lactonase family protein [Candidatus Altimarinota bacterium]
MFRRELKNIFLILIGATLMMVFSSQIGVVWADISNGANAIDLLGQYDGTSVIDPQPIYTKGGVHDGPNRLGFDNPYAVEMDTVNHRLFVSDQNNNRVLVYNLTVGNLLIDRVPDFVLGQTTFAGSAAANTQAGMNLPSGLAYDSVGQRLFVAQIGNNRVTVYDVATIVNGENAVNVIGQANFTGSGAAVTQAGLSTPRHLAYDSAGQRLFVAQGMGVNRVTVYDVAAITDGENAINVLGQINFTNNGVATTQSGLSTPIGLAYDSAGQRLFVTDAGNNRVMVFDVAGITDGENAINVLGQANFTTGTGTTNQSSTAGQTSGAAYDAVGQRLFVSQRNNSRITVFDVAGITDGENAINVLGQATYVSQVPAATQAGLDDPLGMFYDSGNQNLYVAQEANNRISVFEAGAITNGEGAVDLLGQYDGTNLSDPQPIYTKNGANDSPNRYGLSSPSAVAIDSVGHRLFLADQSNNRVLVYNLNVDNSFIDRIPDFVLGQVDFVSNASATTQTGMSQPSGLAFDLAGQRLFVAQTNNNRVTVYDVSTITNGEAAINVLGQTNFTNSAAATTQSGMSAPRQMAYDSAGQRLFVALSSSSRVAVYDVAAITDGENAVNVLGQPDFTSSAPATTQAGMNTPFGVAYDAAGQRLFVGQNNNRVTVYDVAAITDGENAINVLGQIDFTSAAAASSQTGMNAPRHLAYDSVNQRLFVVLFNSDKVMAYDVASVVNGEGAIYVLGQTDFTAQLQATTQSGMTQPNGLAYDPVNENLFVTQLSINRVTVYDVEPDLTAPVVAEVTPVPTPTADTTPNYTFSTNEPGTITYGGDCSSVTTAAVVGNNTVTFNSLALGTHANCTITVTDGANQVSNVLNVIAFEINSSGALLTNGANAIDLLGQYDGSNIIDPQPIFTKSGRDDSANRYGFNQPQAIVLDSVNHRYFVTDYTNNRVLVYNLNVDNTFPDRIPDFVLGQPNFVSNAVAVTQAGMTTPIGLAYDSVNNRLFVAQQSGNRVMVYDVVSITNGENAINVLGQATFTASNTGNTQSGMNGPRDVLYDSATNRLFVSQQGNSRVTVYDVTGITNGEAAINVLGQANFTATAAATTQAGMSSPWGLSYDAVGQRLFVSDQNNNRALVYNLLDGITNGENAVNVLGQAVFTSNSASNLASGLNQPYGVLYDGAGQRLFVSQLGSDRVMVYDIATLTDGESAVNVLGQPNFATSGSSATTFGLFSPRGLVYDAGSQILGVADGQHHRIMFYDVAVVTDGEDAVDMLGQYDGSSISDPQPVYTKGDFTANVNDAPNRLGLRSPSDVEIDRVGHRLFVADSTNRRVLVYNLNVDNTLVDRVPDFVLGQAGFALNAQVLSQSHVSNPQGLAYDSAGQRLFVSDADFHRVMVYDVAVITNGENAVNVLGQANFAGNSSNSTAAGMGAPRGMDYDAVGQRLFVANGNQNRVTVYNLADGITDGENAVNVLGQVNFTNSGSATTQAGMSDPRAVVYDSDNQRLFVAASGNNRVTIYDLSDGITDGENAANVLGQTNFTNGGLAITQAGMYSPRGLAYDVLNSKLFVAQDFANRVTVYDVASITNGENAVNVLGQSIFTTNNALTTQSGMQAPVGMFYDEDNKRVYVAEQTNNRVSIFDAATAGFEVIESAGNTAVTEGGPIDSFDVVLTAIPTSDVVFNITSANPVLLGVSLANLTFTNLNWNVPQTVDVSGLEDDDANDESVNVTVSVNDASSDDSFDVLSDYLVPVTIDDNDVNGFTIDGIISPILLNEGDTETFDVYLTAEPATDVVILIASDMPASVSVDLPSLTFTNANWDAPQIVTITAEEDDLDYDGESATITLSVSDGLSDPDYAAVLDQQIVVNTVDNDAPPDVTPPVIAEVTAVPALTNDNTPSYTFSADEVGTITYGGDCTSLTTVASAGNNTINFETLSDGIHNNCTITVTDPALNVSNILNVTSFTVQSVVTPPSGGGGGGGVGGGFGQPASSGGTQNPTQPSEPEQPTEPQPQEPVEPEQPSQPTEPNLENPTQPEQPVQPTQPNQPVQPTQVNQPVPTVVSNVLNVGVELNIENPEEVIFVTEENIVNGNDVSGAGIYGLEANRTERQLALSCNYGSFGAAYGIEINQSSDADGDGLSDQLECLAQTNPTEADTDGDGLSDAYEELTLGTSPREKNDQPGSGMLVITTPENNMLTGDETPFFKGINSNQGLVDLYIFDKVDFEEISQAIIEELENDENLNDKQRAELFKIRFTEKVQNILAKFIAGELDENNPLEAKFINRIQLLGSATTGNNWIFLLDSGKTLIDNTYLAMAKAGNAFSKEVQFEVDRSLKVLNPEVERLGDKLIPAEALLGELRVEIDSGNLRPVLVGRIKESSKVVANWQSEIVSSALIADSLDEEFRLAAPSDLEPGEHTVYITAYRRSDGAQSETLKIPFVINVAGGEQGMGNWWIYLLAGGGLALVGAGILFMKRKRN